ncbi:EH signature domain-containing protein [Chryseobacterium limigenitum]|uniref:EH_Signature domain-containing protein n=1 Tax=Chryseobacterium limigenitum TaxID=1612149 RepID=A0A1K2IXH2_9FLAO|nr:EH signature domain-containing protein [Chryseobacterium limigenitum]SFZ96896.1 EH_Signature domain-containing protein [Chryseobacterium limigenitum]
MPTSQDILQFHFSPTTFQQSAQKIIPITLSSLNEHRIDKLQKITEEVGAGSFSFSGNNLIPQVFRKFKSFINNSNIVFERRELRTLTYALNHSEQNLQFIFGSENELNYTLQLLESNWRDSFLVGLIDCFLKNWETKHQKSLEQLEQFIAKKLDNYNGNRSTLISFKNNKRYFSTKNGDLILGDTIAKLNKPIQEATKILGVPDSWFDYSYFSKVIITYYERNKSKIAIEVDNLNDVLQKHNSSITSKRLISKIIIQANQPQFTTVQDKIKKIAFTQIGDPSNISNWTAFENATEIEKREIIQGRNILNEWITQQFINVFFNVCINDEGRKKFWLRFASKISSFKVYGPLHTKSILKRDERIAEYVDARFETVSSRRDVSAFILYIGDYMLIEFSIDGYACCAYKTDSLNKPNLTYKLNSVDDLRNSSLPLAVQSDSNYYYTNEEGRLFHNENWQHKFNHWLNEKVLK